MTDLVKRLRSLGRAGPGRISFLASEDAMKAADRIEQLESMMAAQGKVAFKLAEYVDELEAALRKVMIGGNHVALLIGIGHPPHTETHEKALTHYGAGDAYEAWCCWKTIMEARKALEGKDD